MAEYKTPGVYIKEKSAFPSSVVEAETAIPAFIGLTKQALNGTESLLLKPVRISSMTEYITYFGGPPTPTFELSIVNKEEGGELCVTDLKQTKVLNAKFKGTPCTLYYHMVLFFANGGGTCYIMSVGDYKTTFAKAYTAENKEIIFSNLKKTQDITLLVVPEAVNEDNCMNIYTDLLKHCGETNRFAILDIPMSKGNPIEDFRNAIGTTNLSYAAAYYPWLETSVLSDNDINGEVLTWKSYKDSLELQSFFNWAPAHSGDKFPLEEYVAGCFQSIETQKSPGKDLNEEDISQIKNDLHNALMQNWPAYQLLERKVKESLNLLPPSAAMAGLYTMVDHTRGVWKAPANVSVNYVNKTSVIIDNEAQQDLNVPMSGKAINAIRTFAGEGIKVWGARTLNGNSLDWRYINVRRTMSFLETSVKNAARAYVFEPNDANTWINMKCMIENFLRGVWKRGGLAGTAPEDAYSVHVGLGDTMTPEDILEGIMRITVLVAVSHPAEFIEITFQQQMQKS